ncbi:NAD(P)(+) transhydrogenase (Re/Si-specific) subunit alpha, partial [Hansschlegelia beijingensis]
MRIAVAKETDPAETRVALTPDVVKRLVGTGAQVTVESGAGLAAGATDEAYKEAGAMIAGSRGEALSGADVLLT